MLPTSVLFGTAAVLYGVLVPLILLQLIALVFIPSLQPDGAKPAGVGKAIYCYLMQIVGVVFMTVSGIPAVYGVLTQAPVTGQTYLALLLLFIAGGLTFLWHEHQALMIDAPSRAVPYALYWYTFKAAGFVTAVVSGLYLLLALLLIGAFLPDHWWVMPLILLGYGVLLCWCTRGAGVEIADFRKSSLKSPPIPPAHPFDRIAATPSKPVMTASLPRKVARKAISKKSSSKVSLDF